MITDADQHTLDQTRRSAHPRCAACGRAGAEGAGLGLHFCLQDDGSVSADFTGWDNLQGYDGVLHGGVTAMLLDSAMTNCLFAHGIVAVTGELNVRFRHPVVAGEPLTLRARIARRQSPLYTLEAELLQAGELRARATGKFMDKPNE